MAYRLRTTKQFKKDVKRCIKRGLSMDKLRRAMELLEQNGSLPDNYRPHPQLRTRVYALLEEVNLFSVKEIRRTIVCRSTDFLMVEHVC